MQPTFKRFSVTEETRIERDTCTPMFITALFIIARTWQQPRCPSADKWIRKQWYIYTMEYSVQFSSVTQSCLTLCDPMDCSLPGSSVHGILQARVLQWGAIAFSHRVQKSVLYICVSFAILHIGSSEKAMAPHSSTLAWKIPWVEESGSLQSMGLQRVGHN